MIKPTTYIFVLAATILAVTNYLAIELYLYWHYPWFDLATHTLGGAVVALGLFSLRDFMPRLPVHFESLYSVLTLVFMVAVSWEAMEVYAGISMHEPDYVADTIIDLCLGLTGGFIGFVVGRSIRDLYV